MSIREKKPKNASGKRARKDADTKKGTKKRAAKAAAATDAPATIEPKAKKQGMGPLGYILPIMSLAVALVGSAYLFRHFFIEPKEAAAEAAAAKTAAEPIVYADNQAVYNGVSDPWYPEGYFTTGYEDLDQQVKQFCDAVSVKGNSARQNAQLAYNQIIWSNYEGRTEDQKPSGDGWDVASARHFFSTGSPKDGLGGSGDFYEYAAAASFCLRYFGYSDAFATPSLTSTQESIAVCLVTDENGYGCVCDPTYATEGWMLNRSMYTVTVEDLGQDLTKAQALGLKVVNKSAQNATNLDGSPVSNGQDAGNGTDEYGYDAYGYDEYAYVDESYGTYY
ncbi:MAG: hypothetical protein Q4B54_00905 [Coriobacteriales bacterium]|nr:hypothetical protein [Coriobacteriales bacterium]